MAAQQEKKIYGVYSPSVLTTKVILSINDAYDAIITHT